MTDKLPGGCWKIWRQWCIQNTHYKVWHLDSVQQVSNHAVSWPNWGHFNRQMKNYIETQHCDGWPISHDGDVAILHTCALIYQCTKGR